jgi:hypothetical protein
MFQAAGSSDVRMISFWQLWEQSPLSSTVQAGIKITYCLWPTKQIKRMPPEIISEYSEPFPGRGQVRI